MQDSDAPTMKNGTVNLKPSDVLHVPGLGFDGLVGYSPIAMAKNAIGMAIACGEYGAKFFANGATPGGLLEFPGTVKNPDAIRESWNKGFSGSNSHKIAILEEGMKYTPISISPEQAQFLETRKFQIDEIARIFRVPPHMVGDLEKSSFSNIEQQSLEFVKYTLEPWIVRWEQSLNRALLSDSEKTAYFVKFNVDGLLRGDYQSRMNGYATARQNGWMSANDIRELENLDRIPPELGGDLYLINGNMTKLEALKCVGKNPKLAAAKSKNDKNIVGLINQVETNKTVVYSFMNVSPYTIKSSPTQVLSIDFTSKESTTAMFLGEFLLNVIADAPLLYTIRKVSVPTVWSS